MYRMLSMAVLALLLCPAVFAQDQAAKQKAAGQSAQSWLTLLDGAKYGESWQEAASFSQSKISKEDWERALQQTRGPLGVAGTRTLLTAQYLTELPKCAEGRIFHPSVQDRGCRQSSDFGVGSSNAGQ
jgi:hypothetical protein